ncbi:hypothetical protein JCM1393_27840 [Clostridium carnis]
MNRKQFGIIFTLMALIVCVGVLAAKLNKTGYTDPTDLSEVLSQGSTDEKKTPEKDTEKEKDKETLGAQDYFYSLRGEKEQKDAATMQQLNTIIADANTSQAQKDVATNQLTEKTMIRDKENRIVLNVKNKGFEDAICSIDGNKVRIVVKAEELSEADNASIQEIAENVSSISDVIIEVKK